MTISLINLLSFITLLAIFSLISQRRQVLMCLLSLEAVLLSLAFAAATMFSSSTSVHFFYCLVILTFGACEAAVALAILVLITRAFGSDMIQSLNLNKC
uniref:NADH-ubiquinone oxidoreductase chain 4L n=1 Tax=Prionospio sp. 6 MH-2023 TaxID=3059274 RepID=A0AAU6QGZ5_9ANNE